jgi:hypothetical protein
VSSTPTLACQWFLHQYISHFPLNLANTLTHFHQTSLTHIFIVNEVCMINEVSLILVTLLYSSCTFLSPYDSLLLALLHHIKMMLPPFIFITILIDEVHLFVLDTLPVDMFPSPVIVMRGPKSL